MRPLLLINIQSQWNLLTDEERARLRAQHGLGSTRAPTPAAGGPTLDIGMNHPGAQAGQAKRKYKSRFDNSAPLHMATAAAQLAPDVEALFRLAGLTALRSNGGGAETVVTVIVSTNIPSPPLDGRVPDGAREDRTLVFKTSGGGTQAQRVFRHLIATDVAKKSQNAAPIWQPPGASLTLFQSASDVTAHFDAYHLTRRRPNPGLRTAADAAASFPRATGADGALAGGD